MSEVTLNKRELNTPLWRIVFFPMSTINYERFQSMQYCSAMEPLIRKLYPDNKEERIAGAERHMAFFNTTPGPWIAFIMGLSVAQEVQAAGMEPGEERDGVLNSVNIIKASLMGPMAGIGDSMKATLGAVAGAICAGIALNGSIFGCILMIILTSLYSYGVSYYAYQYGYDKGMSLIDDISEAGTFEKVLDCACILGMMALGALVPSWCSFNLNKDIMIGEYAFNIQAAFDSILPKLPPVILTLILAKLYDKKISSLKIVLILFAIALVMSLLGY